MEPPIDVERRRCDSDPQGPHQHEEGHPIDATDHTDGHPWCVEHDPNGTCLGEVRQLPRGGVAWLEGSAAPAIILWLGRPSRGQMSELTAGEAKELTATLRQLADALDGDTGTSRTLV